MGVRGRAKVARHLGEREPGVGEGLGVQGTERSPSRPDMAQGEWVSGAGPWGRPVEEPVQVFRQGRGLEAEDTVPWALGGPFPVQSGEWTGGPPGGRGETCAGL